MRLADVLSGCEYEIVGRNGLPDSSLTKGVLDTEILGITHDSRKVAEKSLFVAISGGTLNGHDFIPDAVARGASAVIYEEDDLPLSLASAVFIKSKDSRRTLACVSNNFYGRPSEGISVIGVTGTNGKTTTTHLIKSILEAWGRNVGLIGTIAYSIGDRQYPAAHTTPEPPEFQQLLSEMAAAGCSHVVTEVSSHSLSQRRVDYTRFAVVAFTNLTRDHLDFHGSMENYFAAKERLFTELLEEAGTAVINLDDPWGQRLLSVFRERHGAKRGRKCPSLITYGTERGDLLASDIESSLKGVSFTLTYEGRSYRMDCQLVGMPNVYNILAAASSCIALNIPIETVREGIRHIGHVKGRLEKLEAGQDFLCIIDYAHTPDALERLIITARALLKNKDRPSRILTLFGCGGDRDRGKRPVMGEIATRLSDYVIITSDNPRSEDPDKIIQEIVAGVSRDNYCVIPDRKEAIFTAVGRSGTGDILLIAGKGHEDYQEIKGIRYPFSDREFAQEAIRNRAVCEER